MNDTLALQWFVRDPGAGTLRAVVVPVPIMFRAELEYWHAAGAEQVRMRFDVSGDIATIAQRIERLRESLGGVAMSNPAMLYRMLEIHVATDLFIERFADDPGHPELLIEEAKALAYESPFDYVTALRIIERRELALRNERSWRYMRDAMRETGRALAEAFAIGMNDAVRAAERAKELGRDDDPDCADDRRLARLGAFTRPRRCASDPEYHRWATWRHRNGIDRHRRLPMIHTRGEHRRRR